MPVSAIALYADFRHTDGMQKEPGIRLCELREKADWSMEKLASKVMPPTSASTINKLEKGETEFTMLWARRFARVFEVHYLEFFEAIPAPAPRVRSAMELFGGLSEADQDAAYRVLDAMAQSHELKKPGNDR